MFISKQQVKQQCKLELEDDSEDRLLDSYIAAVEQKTIAYLNRHLYLTSVPGTDANGIVINPSITQGMLLLVASLYDRRADVSTIEQSSVFPVFKFLVDDYRLSGL